MRILIAEFGAERHPVVFIEQAEKREALRQRIVDIRQIQSGVAAVADCDVIGHDPPIRRVVLVIPQLVLTPVVNILVIVLVDPSVTGVQNAFLQQRPGRNSKQVGYGSIELIHKEGVIYRLIPVLMAVIRPFAAGREGQLDVEIQRALIQRDLETVVPSDVLLMGVFRIGLDPPCVAALIGHRHLAACLHISNGDVFFAPVLVLAGGELVFQARPADGDDAVSDPLEEHPVDDRFSLVNRARVKHLIRIRIMRGQLVRRVEVGDDPLVHPQDGAVNEGPVVQAVGLVVVQPDLVAQAEGTYRSGDPGRLRVKRRLVAHFLHDGPLDPGQIPEDHRVQAAGRRADLDPVRQMRAHFDIRVGAGLVEQVHLHAVHFPDRKVPIGKVGVIRLGYQKDLRACHVIRQRKRRIPVFAKMGHLIGIGDDLSRRKRDLIRDEGAVSVGMLEQGKIPGKVKGSRGRLRSLTLCGAGRRIERGQDLAVFDLVPVLVADQAHKGILFARSHEKAFRLAALERFSLQIPSAGISGIRCDHITDPVKGRLNTRIIAAVSDRIRRSGGGGRE